MTTQEEARELLRLALAKVDSLSIRAWAQSAHNAPVWQKIAEGAVRKGKSPANADDVLRFSTYIVCEAMGF